MRVDLHLHTWVSDGQVSPAELVRLATGAGLGAIAVTDHDTAAGVAEALLAAAATPMTVVPGIEISTRWEQTELHVLGYWIDPDSEPILRHQKRAVRRRLDRMKAMVERLQTLGVNIDLADVELAAGSETRVLGRPHLARALHAGGHTRYYGEAFARYIGDAGPAYVAEGFPVPSEAIRTIHDAGGLAVWAHPPIEALDLLLPLMVQWGLDGLECYRPGADPNDLSILESSARAHDLFPTGGSDWHGPHRAALGEFAVDSNRLRDVLSFGPINL